MRTNIVKLFLTYKFMHFSQKIEIFKINMHRTETNIFRAFCSTCQPNLIVQYKHTFFTQKKSPVLPSTARYVFPLIPLPRNNERSHCLCFVYSPSSMHRVYKNKNKTFSCNKSYNCGQLHGLTSSCPITEVKQPWLGLDIDG